MLKQLLLSLVLAIGCMGQASHIGSIPDNGPSVPGTCNPPQIFFQTGSGGSGAGLYACASANSWTGPFGTGGGSGSTTIKTNGTNNSDQTVLNFLNSAATNGLTYTFTNTSGGVEQFSVTGTYSGPAGSVTGETFPGWDCLLALPILKR